MKRILFICFTVLMYSITFGQVQKVQWASKVLEFSSELTPLQYAARQALDKPNVLPVGGESPNAWTPDRANRDEFLKVGFDSAMKVSQILIAESYNPSAITKVYLYDVDNKEYLINSFEPVKIPVKGRLLNIFIDETDYLVQSVKLEFNGKPLSDFYSIDAIGISNSIVPADVEVQIPDSLSDEIIVERLSENVNSTYKEYKPLLSPDGKTLFFSRKNHPENIGGVNDDEDIWYSEMDTTTGEWQLAQNMGPELNTKDPNFVSSITPDGKSVVLLLGNKYVKKGKMEAGVSITSNKGGEWSPPRALEIENEYNLSEKANYFMANNRKILLMSVQREDSYGDRDLYVSFLEPDSTWTEPQNIGENVNTAGEEAGPFLAADNKTLYFSSNGYSGYGGHDIYVTRRLDDTWLRWSDPLNMGPQINSPLEDVFFNIPVTGEYAYYSRGMNENDTDIHRVKFPIFVMPEAVITLRGRLINEKTGEPVEAGISYNRLPDGVEIGVTSSEPETGKYEIVLPIGDLYAINSEVEGFLPLSENIDLREVDTDNEIMEKDLKLVPVEPEATIVMNNIFFDFDKASLKEESYQELSRLLNFLKENKKIKVLVKGHTDSMGPEEYNIGLSRRRAETVEQYFIEQGIEDNRIEVKYFGESKPVSNNDTEEGRAKNRRVEFEILESEK